MININEIPKDSPKIADSVREVLQSFTRENMRIDHYRTDLWLVFNSYTKREQCINALKAIPHLRPTKFKNQADDNKEFPFGIEVPFSYSY